MFIYRKNDESMFRSHLIRILRLESKYSLENVSKDLAIPKTTLYQYEKGTLRMNEDEFSRFVQYYRIDFDPNILCICLLYTSDAADEIYTGWLSGGGG